MEFSPRLALCRTAHCFSAAPASGQRIVIFVPSGILGAAAICSMSSAHNNHFHFHSIEIIIRAVFANSDFFSSASLSPLAARSANLRNIFRLVLPRLDGPQLERKNRRNGCATVCVCANCDCSVAFLSFLCHPVCDENSQRFDMPKRTHSHRQHRAHTLPPPRPPLLNYIL